MTLELISHRLCPYVQRAAITLLEKKVAFERRDVDLSNKPDWFTAISPLGKTPLLRIDDRDVLFESAAICEYLDETQEEPRLHPADPLSRARHRGWIEFASATLNDIAGLYNAPDVSAFERKRDDLKAKFAQVENALSDVPFFAGANFSLVDAAFAPVFRYFDTFETVAELSIFADKPKCSAWREALAARPSVVRAVDSEYASNLTQFLAARGSFLGGLVATRSN